MLSNGATCVVGIVVGLLLPRWLLSAPNQTPVRIHDARGYRPATEHAPAPTPAPAPLPVPAPSVSLPPPPPAAAAVNATIMLGGIGPFDLDSRDGLRAAVAARSVRSEIVTFTSNVGGLAAAANMALQLRRHRILHHMVLADARSTCITGSARWPWLGCGWSSGLPGFEAAYANGVGGATAHLWSLWSAKWLLVARLTELRINVLALDTDMMLQANPYPLLTSAPIDKFQMIIVPEGSRVNLGFIYVRGNACHPAGGVASVLWDVVRRLRLFTEDYPLLSRKGKQTSTYGLWDQGLFTDAITSAVDGALVYPYTYLQSPLTPVWKALHWPPEGMSAANLSKMHVVRWRDYGDPRNSQSWLDDQGGSYGAPTHAVRPAAFLPPAGHPQRREWEGRRLSLLWVPMHVVDPLAHLSQRRLSSITPGWLSPAARPGAGGLWPQAGPPAHIATARANAELLLATPDWLYCLVGRWAITAGWPSLKPATICAVLHLVECRAQFGGWNSNKGARPYVQRALGYWHLPEPLPAPLGSTLEPPALAIAPTARAGAPRARAIRLPQSEWVASAKARGIGALINALQRLALYAAITGRAPVIPSIPCHSKWIQRNAFGRAGLADDYILQIANRTAGGFERDGVDGGIECHPALGGRQCMLPLVLPAWTRVASGAISFLDNATPEGALASSISVQLTATNADGVRCTTSHEVTAGRRLALDVAALRDLAARHADAPMLEVTSHLTVAGMRLSRDASMAWRCRAPDSIDAMLLPDEERRLSALRSACEGYFGARGAERGQLDWIHRRRTRRGVEL